MLEPHKNERKYKAQANVHEQNVKGLQLNEMWVRACSVRMQVHKELHQRDKGRKVFVFFPSFRCYRCCCCLRPEHLLQSCRNNHSLFDGLEASAVSRINNMWIAFYFHQRKCCMTFPCMSSQENWNKNQAIHRKSERKKTTEMKRQQQLYCRFMCGCALRKRERSYNTNACGRFSLF